MVLRLCRPIIVLVVMLLPVVWTGLNHREGLALVDEELDGLLLVDGC